MSERVNERTRRKKLTMEEALLMSRWEEGRKEVKRSESESVCVRVRALTSFCHDSFSVSMSFKCSFSLRNAGTSGK